MAKETPTPLPVTVLRGKYDLEARSRASGLTCSDPSKAVQSQKDDADINVIVKRFGVTGQLPAAVLLPEYGDFTGIDNYRDAIEAVRTAEEEFLKIPSEVRAKFNHDPQAWLEYVNNPANQQWLAENGYLKADAAARVLKGLMPSDEPEASETAS